MPDEENVARMMALFPGREANAYETRGATRAQNGKVTVVPKVLHGGPPTAELWAEHLRGDIGLGVIGETSEGLCSYGTIDDDALDVDLFQTIARVDRLGLPLVPCKSKSGALHLFLFLTTPVPKDDLKRALRALARRLGIRIKERGVAGGTVDIIAGTNVWMPYCGSNCGGLLQDQVGLRQTGGELTIEEFIRKAGDMRVTPEQLAELVGREAAAAAAAAAADDDDDDEAGFDGTAFAREKFGGLVRDLGVVTTNRNDKLASVAFSAGSMIARGWLDEEEARRDLWRACETCGLACDEQEKSRSTIERCLAAGKLRPHDTPRRGPPPIRVVDGDIARVVDEAEQALIDGNVPVFARAGALCQPITDDRRAADGGDVEVTVLRQLAPSTLGYVLNRDAATFKKHDGRSGRWRRIDPPERVLNMLLGKGNWQLHSVSGVVTAPTLRPDGSVLAEPGYDAETKLWYAPASNLTMPAIGETRADAEAALRLLDDLLGEFPFVGDTDRAVAIAELMTPVLRGACDVVPLLLNVAHSPGSGKSYLADIANTIVRGQRCPAIVAPASQEELEKRLSSVILEGAQVISLDNCSHDLGGDMLCQVTERQVVKIRILGKSETPECEFRGTVFANGNNITIRGDMTRRALICNLDPGVERPELRKFEHDPIRLVMADRGKYVAAILTIARAYLASGEATGCGPLGSYGMWSRVVREPIVWLGRPDPVGSMEQAREMDPERAAVRELIAHWDEFLSRGRSYTAADIIACATAREEHGGTYAHPEFHALLVSRCGSGDRIEVRRLGNWLMRIRGQRHDGYRVELAQERQRGNRYVLVGPGRESQPQLPLSRREDVPF